MLKNDITPYIMAQGADIVGFAPVALWPEFKEVPPDFWPDAIWEPARCLSRSGNNTG